MGSNPTPPPMTTISVTTTEDAIKFLGAFKAGCARSIEWWLWHALDEFSSVEARATAARALDKATRLDQVLEQLLDAALESQRGVRLNMDAADETPAQDDAPAREGDVPRAPTRTPSTNLKASMLPHGTYGRMAIETRAQTIVLAALGGRTAILDAASRDPHPGTASIRFIKNIYAPRTLQATSAARAALDALINGFVKDCGLHLFFTNALEAALVCRYYQPSNDWHSHVINEMVLKIDEYGPDSELTLAVSRSLETDCFLVVVGKACRGLEHHGVKDQTTGSGRRQLY
jgi:hypothetical protein